MVRNRSLRLDLTWDNADAPAVSVPVGDFFCHPLCYDLPLENSLFADPTGRSSLCFIPMPFRERATVRIVNEFDRPVTVFHNIRFVQGVEPGPDDGYLHACFRRTVPTEPGFTHEVLPLVRGRGRYLGTHLGIIADRYNPLHWSGGNMKFFFDGDDAGRRALRVVLLPPARPALLRRVVRRLDTPHRGHNRRGAPVAPDGPPRPCRPRLPAALHSGGA